MKALAKLGAVLLVCVLLTGIAVKDSVVLNTVAIGQLEQITFCEDFAASAEAITIKSQQEITQIAMELSKIRLHKLDVTTFYRTLTKENLDCVVWLQYAAEPGAESNNPGVFFLFCKNGSVAIENGDANGQYYMADYAALKKLLTEIAARQTDSNYYSVLMIALPE